MGLEKFRITETYLTHREFSYFELPTKEKEAITSTAVATLEEKFPNRAIMPSPYPAIKVDEVMDYGKGPRKKTRGVQIKTKWR